MSATTAGALKAHLEGKGRGVPWFRYRAPKDQALPFGVIQDGISTTPLPMGDTSDPAADKVVTELAQCTLFQEWRDSDGNAAEQYPLPGQIYRDLDGAVLATHPAGTTHVKVRGVVRLPRIDSPGTSAAEDADGANLIQDTFTVSLHRSV